MNFETKKVALACFLGAFIGGLLALQLGIYYWWIGIVVGGLVGYLSYEWEQIPKAARYVWEKMPESNKIATTTLTILKGFGLVIIALAVISCGITLLISGCIIALGSAISGLASIITLLTDHRLIYMPNDYYVFVWGFIPVAAFGTFIVNDKWTEGEKNGVFSAVMLLGTPLLAPIFMPLLALILAIATSIGILAAIIGTAVYSKKWLFFGYSYTKQLFILIHSELRLICMTDAMIGALIGYFTGNALIGGIAGAIIGVINFEVISVRVLKLVVK